MPYDLVIKNGVLIDGSGLPRYHADVAVRHGRIASVGRIRERAREVIDADGLVVTPGFIDGHTHMDAQIFWDPEDLRVHMRVAVDETGCDDQAVGVDDLARALANPTDRGDPAVAHGDVGVIAG